MTKKIFKSMMAIAITVMVLCSAFLLGILYDHFSDRVMDEIRNQAYFIAEGIAADDDAYLDRIHEAENRITLIESDGTVIFDTKGNAAEMENHSDREEVREARSFGEGTSRRYSNTIGTQTLYCAKQMEDGRIIRVSAEINSVWSLVLGVVYPMVFVLILTSILAVFLSKRSVSRIVAPVNTIDLENPEFEEPYDEFAPFLKKIHMQNARIQEQMQELKRRQTEFGIITENMSEGFLIIDEKTEILSYNSAALKLLNVTAEDAEKSKSVLAVNRSESFRTVVEDALAGKHSEQPMQAGDRFYHIVANPVIPADKAIGVIIIILDVTEKEQRELLRREFTSNVSHELKTPLTTIYGISDMICGGMVKESDIKGFSETIRDETGRMITLIDDIIKLSRLDEGRTDIEMCNVDLLTTASAVAQRLQYASEKAGIMISVKGDSTVVRGAPAMLEEMMYNLVDNAVKYNRENGTVVISVGETDGRKFFSVEDTGIGIPKDAQERVFERFYRVDKSHSRKIGGTGLGLSIVKHGAVFHKAEVALESTEGVGTTVKVSF